ncbi:hypothetical protein LZ016_06575 [Sphingomonas sp. SM33]|uniref:Uncharacterized protein n=1 Tax=Sphingomonas telluris TaxID=2907998 RepID=A0ABS9VLB4_9SPHN|nr:hypothetical protein [Sphingomonas telluris]MCH8615764.1 hypothetical protein [Sphingomonas telluris]
MMSAAAIALMIFATTTGYAAGKEDAVAAFVQQTLGTSSYMRADADLNGDGRSEALLYVTDKDYCGSGGCTLLVLSKKGGRYRVVLRSTVTQLPIRVLSTSTRGWRDIGVTVAGGGITRPYVARLWFNGSSYPGNPTVAPAIPLKRPSGKILIGG